MFGLSFTLDDLKRALWTAVQAGVLAFLVLAPGILMAPNLAEAKALGIAALIAAGAAAFSALKNLILSDGSALK
jgi:hypothetical protein